MALRTPPTGFTANCTTAPPSFEVHRIKSCVGIKVLGVDGWGLRVGGWGLGVGKWALEFRKFRLRKVEKDGQEDGRAHRRTGI